MNPLQVSTILILTLGIAVRGENGNESTVQAPSSVTVTQPEVKAGPEAAKEDPEAVTPDTNTASSSAPESTTTICHDSYPLEQCAAYLEESGPEICALDFKVRWLCCQTCEEACETSGNNETVCAEPKDHPCDNSASVSPPFCQFMGKKLDICHGDGIRRLLAFACAKMCFCS